MPLVLPARPTHRRRLVPIQEPGSASFPRQKREGLLHGEGRRRIPAEACSPMPHAFAGRAVCVRLARPGRRRDCRNVPFLDGSELEHSSHRGLPRYPHHGRRPANGVIVAETRTNRHVDQTARSRLESRLGPPSEASTRPLHHNVVGSTTGIRHSDWRSRTIPGTT